MKINFSDWSIKLQNSAAFTRVFFGAVSLSESQEALGTRLRLSKTNSDSLGPYDSTERWKMGWLFNREIDIEVDGKQGRISQKSMSETEMWRNFSQKKKKKTRKFVLRLTGKAKIENTVRPPIAGTEDNKYVDVRWKNYECGVCPRKNFGRQAKIAKM